MLDYGKDLCVHALDSWAVGWPGGCHAAGVGQAVEICLKILNSFMLDYGKHLCVHALDSWAMNLT